MSIIINLLNKLFTSKSSKFHVFLFHLWCLFRSFLSFYGIVTLFIKPSIKLSTFSKVAQDKLECNDKSKNRKITLDINIKPHYDVTMSNNLLLWHQSKERKNALWNQSFDINIGRLSCLERKKKKQTTTRVHNADCSCFTRYYVAWLHLSVVERFRTTQANVDLKRWRFFLLVLRLTHIQTLCASA